VNALFVQFKLQKFNFVRQTISRPTRITVSLITQILNLCGTELGGTAAKLFLKRNQILLILKNLAKLKFTCFKILG
jgi:hypothetical protein